ncbi:MAG: hypothetical protein JWN38_734 [Candidatus Saccharibacteria bacterium]|nr:hypothetical protein [Candidatus Saccharibacteria bacterium]
MVGTAELEQIQIDNQFYEITGDFFEEEYTRPPELEVYGRSFSTVHRLGVLMVGATINESTKSPEADQARVEFCTSVEEGFGTDMELGGGLEVRDFDTRHVVGGKVMAKDLKTAVSDMTNAGLICAQETVKKDERFRPQLIRSKWDHENAIIVDEMARGETGYNTRIAVSPFPEEAAAESGDEYWRTIGYVPHLKRGFVQMYHATEAGEVVAGSLSFDGSNKDRLRAVFAKHNVIIPETEVTDNWLQYAVTETLSEDQAKALAMDIADQAKDPGYVKSTNTVDVTREYRTVMDTVFENSYVHACESLARGSQTPGARKLIFELADNAQHFNDRYADALYSMCANEQKFNDEDMAVLHDLLVYSTIEMMRALHLDKKRIAGHTEQRTPSSVAYLQSLDAVAFQHTLGDFAAAGAQNNRVYSACGLSIAVGEAAAIGEQGVFGGTEGLTLPREDRYGSLEFKCPKGHTNTRPHGKLIENCRICGTSVRC